MLDVDALGDYLTVVDAVDGARRMLRAYDAGQQTLGVVAWSLAELGRQVDRAADQSSAWFDERVV
ncbi:hypothetical protein GHK86_02590 [Acidimicrobiaceae bacterium USS-CC1]|uniref:Uncharacterized protein n=1 Tax=Acidiferrimicrobium australe TaxID=2664430 RepID=A0ABW9QP88_9ACTN|nr:hypothetical protein [Acidiferrimicrobium australe]